MVGEGSIVAAGCVVGVGQVIPPQSLVVGVPGKVIKAVNDEDADAIRKAALKYTRLAFNYKHA